jgi:hypothetical protein
MSAAVSVSLNPKKSTPRTRKPSPNAQRGKRARGQVRVWAHRYTAVAVVMSSVLNAYAAASHAADGGTMKQIAASAVSALVPVLVWGLAQLGGWLVRAGKIPLAKAAGGVGVGMLLLSVWHVSEAIALLTGQGLVLSVLLAVGIDCGLVTSELSAISVSEEE